MHVPLDKEVLQAVDCVIIATDHSNVNYEWVIAHAPLVLDSRNVAKHISAGRAKVIKL
jgi:UDP-N-acetyl-D-mannosaminuronate dehydrogenase